MDGLADYPPCPTTPRPEGSAEPASANEYAVSFWHELPLPEPAPGIAPGRAITGLTAYLETKGVTSADYGADTPLGPMEISARGSYTVDWGDGTTSGPYAFEGGPWPDGHITHQYQRVGTYDVVVTESWTATWRLGDESGTLAALRTTGTITEFPVQQIQAVVER